MPTGCRTVGNEFLNLLIRWVRRFSQKQAVLRVRCKKSKLTSRVVSRAHRTCACQLASPVNCQRPLKYFKRSGSVKPHAPFKTCECCRGRAGGNLPTSRSLDTGAAHATCCALGEATRGHNTALPSLRFPASSLALTSGPPTSSPLPSTTRTPPSTFRSALRTPSRLCLTAHESGVKPNFLVSARTFPAPRSSGAPKGDLSETF